MQPSRMWHCVVGWSVPGLSKDSSAFTCKFTLKLKACDPTECQKVLNVQWSHRLSELPALKWSHRLSETICPTMIPQTVRNSLPNHTASHPRTLAPSASLLWEAQISKYTNVHYLPVYNLQSSHNLHSNCPQKHLGHQLGSCQHTNPEAYSLLEMSLPVDHNQG